MPLAAQISPKRKGRRGTELVEFTMVLLPFLSILFVLVDVSWAIFAKSTIIYAVRTGVRYGITITGTQVTTASQLCGCSSSLTQMVKDSVQANALGFLNGTAGRSYIQVHYFTQDSTSSTGLTDVSTLPSGNSPGNLMQVSVTNFPLPGLVPRIYYWFTAADKSAANLSAVSADKIEPSGDIPPIGTAP
ncbi:MAG: TadE/TadG family type IV pilus assembly protein [Bryobacteraceae bacterium]